MKDKLKILVMIIFGIIIGIFSKYGDTSGKTFSHYFGNGTFIIEIILSIIGYIIINKESNKKNSEGNENNESGF